MTRNTPFLVHSGILIPPFCKRRSFEHEREIRIVHWNNRFLAREEQAPPSMSARVDLRQTNRLDPICLRQERLGSCPMCESC